MRGIAFAFSLVLVGCGGSEQGPVSPDASAVAYGGGNGSDCETAIVIQGARNEQEGVAAEYSWLNKHIPGAEVQKQALIECKGRPADRLTITTSNGETRQVFFDINDFFGKL